MSFPFPTFWCLIHFQNVSRKRIVFMVIINVFFILPCHWLIRELTEYCFVCINLRCDNKIISICACECVYVWRRCFMSEFVGSLEGWEYEMKWVLVAKWYKYLKRYAAHRLQRFFVTPKCAHVNSQRCMKYCQAINFRKYKTQSLYQWKEYCINRY